MQHNTVGYRRRRICSRDAQDKYSFLKRCFNSSSYETGTRKTWHFSLLQHSLLSLFNTAPFYSLRYNSQRWNRRNRGLNVVTNWQKWLILHTNSQHASLIQRKLTISTNGIQSFGDLTVQNFLGASVDMLRTYGVSRSTFVQLCLSRTVLDMCR